MILSATPDRLSVLRWLLRLISEKVLAVLTATLDQDVESKVQRRSAAHPLALFVKNCPALTCDRRLQTRCASLMSPDCAIRLACGSPARTAGFGLGGSVRRGWSFRVWREPFKPPCRALPRNSPPAGQRHRSGRSGVSREGATACRSLRCRRVRGCARCGRAPRARGDRTSGRIRVRIASCGCFRCLSPQPGQARAP